MAIRNTREVVFSYAPNQDDPLQVMGYGTATSAGAAGGTTLIDAGGIADSGSADTYNGRYFVECLSGSNRGLSRRVIDDNGSGTLTFDGNGFPNQIASGVEYRLIKSSEPVAVFTSTTSSTVVEDTVRDEADDYWIGYELSLISGGEAGETQTISDFTSATGQFTVDTAFSAQPGNADADTALVRKVLEVGGVSLTVDRNYIQRNSARFNLSRNSGIIGAKTASISFDVQMAASGALAASDAPAGGSAISGLMQAVGLTEVIGKSCTIDDAAATTTVVDVASGDRENLSLGMAVQYQGNVAFVTDMADGGAGADTITVAPALPVAPADTDTLQASRMYRIDTDAQRKGVTIYYERDGIRFTLFDCMGNLEIVPGDSSEVIFRFNLNAAHYIEENEDDAAGDCLSAAYSSAQVIMGSDRLFYLDSTQYDVSGVSVNVNHTAAAKNVSGKYGLNGMSGYQTVDIAPSVSFTQLWDDDDDGLDGIELFNTQTQKAVAMVYGSHGNCFAIRMPAAEVTSYPAPGDQEGLMTEPYTMEARDAGCIDAPSSTKDPDFVICIF